MMLNQEPLKIALRTKHNKNDLGRFERWAGKQQNEIHLLKMQAVEKWHNLSGRQEPQELW